jgi:hypothetical protein
MGWRTGDPTLEQIERAIDGRGRLTWRYGGHYIDRLNRKQRERYDAAVAKGYIVVGRNENDPATTAFFYRQMALDLPYVRVKPGRRFSVVDVDLITTDDRRLDLTQQMAVRRLLRAYTEPGKDYAYGSMVFFSRYVPNERAGELAAQLYAIACKGRQDVSPEEWIAHFEQKPAKVPTFTAWLRSHRPDDEEFWELARATRWDDEWPWKATEYADYRRHLVERDAGPEELEELVRAWDAYQCDVALIKGRI